MTSLIVFSHLRWGFVYQRPQHLMSRLATHYQVYFFEEPVRSVGAARLERVVKGPNLDVLVPHTPVEAPGFHDDQLSVLKPLLSDFLRERGIDDYLVWFYTPMALPLMAQLQPRAVVYDCMDELAAFKDAPRQLRQRETALIKVADVMFTGGPALFESKRALHPNLHCLPSSVDAAHFAPARLDPTAAEATRAERLQGELPSPRLGYFGVIDERLDIGLLQSLAQAKPDWQFVMVGPVVKIDPARLPVLSNIHWLGMQPYEMLPYLMADWDVCLMPFALNESTRFISPTKTLEYLAGEKPIVSTPVHDVVGLYGEVVSVASGVDAFMAACEAVLAESSQQRSERLERSLAVVRRSSWDLMAATVQHLLSLATKDSPVTAPAPAAWRELAGLSVEGRDAGPAASAAPTSPAVQTAPIQAAGGRLPRQVRHLVIGAGPTGLAAAYHLGHGAAAADTVLLEREERVGGWCRSVEDRGYTFDIAGHIMFSNDPYVLDLYARLLGDNVHWQNREAWIWSKEVYTRYPFQGSLYGLPPKVLKECLVGAIEARYGALKADGTVARPASLVTSPPTDFADFIQRVWGAGIGKHFATPYNRKLWALPLEEMETSWLGGRVPMPDLEQMIDGALEPTPAPMGPNARFGYPLRGGFQALMDGFLPLMNCELSLKTSVLHVSPSRRTVRLDDGRLLAFDSLISTMPLPLLVEACGEEAPVEVQRAAKGLRHVSVRNVNLGVQLDPGGEKLTEKHWIYYPEETVFHRIFVQGNASPHNNPPGGFALICEITYSPSKPLPCDGQALIDRVIADCRKVGIIGPETLVPVSHQIDMPCAYVVYDHDRAANVGVIRDWFSSFGIVLAGRYSEWEYYNSDHAFIAGRHAAEQAMKALAGAGKKSSPSSLAKAG